LGKSVYFVSISGNTISNIKAAQLVRAGISITRNPKSKLAHTCKNIMPLDYTDSGILTAGTVGFLASALTCISLVYDLKISGAKNLYESAKKNSDKVVMHNKVYFLGNQHTSQLQCTHLQN
ncbi:MAG TPA: sugar isomerase, partial [Candidatus Nitrosotenuis sp.]|nr:sugar isomerase [Candidatus Nitrosotenuis sp.]